MQAAEPSDEPDAADAAAALWLLKGSRLPDRWQGRQQFVVLLTDFGHGEAFLALWQAWRADHARPARLVVLAIAERGLSAGSLANQEPHQDPRQRADPRRLELASQWPVDTPDLHSLSFEQGQVKLLLALGDPSRWMAQWVAEVDAFWLPRERAGLAVNTGQDRWYRQCARLAAADATLAGLEPDAATRSKTCAALSAAGFLPSSAPSSNTREPRFQAKLRPSSLAARMGWRSPGRQAAPACQTALVIGAGLAGSAAAAALARQGVQVTVLDRCAGPAEQTSGNVGGLFHAVVHPQDGLHARLLRAGALHTARLVRPLLESGELLGECRGFLRGVQAKGSRDPLPGMLKQLQRQGLPPEFAQAVSAAEASALAGMNLAQPAWFFADGGWLSPAGLVRHGLTQAGITLRLTQAVQTVRPMAGGAWQALDSEGKVLGEADVLVVAGARDGLSLLQDHADLADWPLLRSRGQITQLDSGLLQTLSLPKPGLPVASGGYALRLPAELGAGLLCGATNQPGDEDPAMRAADHLHNLAQLDELSGQAATPAALQNRARETERMGGRVGWRLTCDDRLPLMGPVALPMAQMPPVRGLEQPRQVPRVPGLYVLSALGSRGLTLAPLLGDALAAWITGTPSPMEASLLDAVDPARFTSRRVRRRS